MYRILRKNKFFEANRRIVEFEIQPSNTVTFLSEVDLSQVEELRVIDDKKISYTAFVAKAVALALREFPIANRRICRKLPFFGHRLQQFEEIDIAIACERDIAGAEGLAFIDVLRGVDQLALPEIRDWLYDLANCDTSTNEQWRSFENLISRLPNWLSNLLIRLPFLSPAAWVRYRGGAVLISSPAKYGVDAVMATWSWPLGLSFGYVKERPVVKDNQVIPCPTFLLTMNFDRRILAGAPAARFFDRVVKNLQNASTTMRPFIPGQSSPLVAEQALQGH